MAQSIAGYEASAEVTTFTSKFDAVLANKAQFAPQEQAGYDLFRGKAQCNSCHRDGGPGEDPLFTDFTASNIGVPANPRLPYYVEDHPDALGYVANPQVRHSSTAVSAASSSRAIRLANLPWRIRDGSSSRHKTRRAFRCRRCATWTNDPIQPL